MSIYPAALDDRQARVLAEQLGLKVVGMIGILLIGRNLGDVLD